MPYEREESKLEQLILRAVESGEMRGGAWATGLSVESLLAHARSKQDGIWDGVKAEIDFHDELELRFDHARHVSRGGLVGAQARALSNSFAASVWWLGVSLVAIVWALGWQYRGSIRPWDWSPGWESNLLAGAAFLLLALQSSVVIRKSSRAWVDCRSALASVPELGAKLVAQAATIEETIYVRVREVLRTFINQYLSLQDEVTLKPLHAEGLSEVHDPVHDVATPQEREIRELLESMNGAAIGIAGPRGVGKTTLIRSLCSTHADESDERPTVAVNVSAPIQYEPREFILSLFAELTKEVLRMAGYAPTQSGTRGGALAIGDLQSAMMLVAKPLTTMAIIMGTAGVVLAVGGSALDWTPMAVSTVFGTALMLGAIILFASQVARGSRASRIRSAWTKLPGRSSAWPDEPFVSEISESSLENLTDIRYQLSYSSGWSGGLKLPIGVHADASLSVQEAQRSMTMPEIVMRYREYVQTLTRQSRVVIGIDEMDKIESDAHAQRFLNEIKSLFGISGCYYFVSVSENAMSKFQRRGLPFRDAFDSAFDSVIYVDYLDAAAARRILSARVIGVPTVFGALCHCLAGGLPREVIRTCREMLGVVREHGDHDIGSVARALVEADLSSKIRAIYVDLRETRGHPVKAMLISELSRLERASPSSEELFSSATVLLVSNVMDREERPTDPLFHGLLQRAEEIGVFIYYLATVLDAFTSRADGSLLATSEELDLELLAKVRQTLALDPTLANQQLHELRESVDLPCIK